MRACGKQGRLLLTVRAFKRNVGINLRAACCRGAGFDLARQRARDAVVYPHDKPQLIGLGVARDVRDRERMSLRRSVQPRSFREFESPTIDAARRSVQLESVNRSNATKSAHQKEM